MKDSIFTMLMYGVPAILLIYLLVKLLLLRRIVPTNVVHIVQRGAHTVSYGVGRGSNVYYAFPKWIPYWGVEVRELPVSNFGIDLPKYSAYDQDRVPFEVDIKAFFHIADTNKAAEKVASYQDLIEQLTNVVKGSVRSILAKAKLEQIMQERSVFGKQFTDAVTDDLKSWGVEPVKSIELMDVRDTADSTVIHQIMAKRMSAISMESRTEVAKNNRSAEQSELEARKDVALTKADTEKTAGEALAQSQQAIGIAKATSTKNQGIAEQTSLMEIAKASKITAEQNMEVIKVNQVKQAEIDKENAIVVAEQERKKIEIAADADKYRVETAAAAKLEAQKKDAEAIRQVGTADADIILAKGLSTAESKKQYELANVVAQTTLADKIGENESYQGYLVKIREIEITGEVNKVQYTSLATALGGAELKLLVNSGDVNSGLNKFSDILSSKGGSVFNGLLESLKQTPEGEKFLKSIAGDAVTKKD